MAEVLSPPIQPHSPLTPPEDQADTPPARPRPRSHLSSSARSARLSTLSRQSRPQSVAYSAANSSLPYAAVRDFAYPLFHPLHNGPPPEPPSGTSTPGSEWASSRRLSDPLDAWNNSRSSNWGAGPWGGDGVMYADPAGDDGEALPATSFGEDVEDDGTPGIGPRRSKHRKSKSYTDFSDLDRGRRSDSNFRRSRASGEGSDYFAGGAKLDPAGQSSLRQSRNYGRKSAGTLPPRSFHTGHLPEPENDEDLLPLDAEQSAHAQSPQRASMGPEDEELYAGESLALYSFEPENTNELRLREGQIILVSYRHGQGWLVAEDPETGEQGLVPEEYVRLVREIETWDPERGGFIEDDSMVVDDTEQSESQLNDVTPTAGPGEGYDQQLQTNKLDDLVEGRQDSAHGEP